jgi:hypothetical protein
MLLAKRFGGKRLTAGLRKPPTRSHLQRVGHRNDDTHPKVIDRLVNRNSCYLGGKPPEGD